MTMEIRGDEKIARILKGLAGTQHVRATVRFAGLHTKSIISPYPEQRPKPSEIGKVFYERRYGPKWRLKGGGEGGKKTSEILSARWTITSLFGGLGVRLANNAGYAGLVHDAEKQSFWHRMTGWITDKTAIQKATPEVMKMLSKSVQEIMRGGS